MTLIILVPEALQCHSHPRTSQSLASTLMQHVCPISITLSGREPGRGPRVRDQVAGFWVRDLVRVATRCSYLDTLRLKQRVDSVALVACLFPNVSIWSQIILFTQRANLCPLLVYACGHRWAHNVICSILSKTDIRIIWLASVATGDESHHIIAGTNQSCTQSQ